MNPCRYETADLSTKFFSRTWTKFRIESQKRLSKLRSFIYIICLRVVTNLWLIRWVAETLSYPERPLGLQGVEASGNFKQSAHERAKVVSPTPQPPPPTPPRVIPGLLFLFEEESRWPRRESNPRSASTNCATVYLMIFRTWRKILVYHAK